MYGNTNYGGGYGQPQQSQYGAPQQQYGAPPQQYGGGGAYPGPGMQGGAYGAPPPQQQYGAPAANQYGAPQAAYGAPPANQYGAPAAAGQYGAPAAAGQYGAPAANQYGAPAQNAYGAPPAANQYGATPANQYGAPAQNAYGAPPQQNYGQPTQPAPGLGPMYLGVPVPAPPPAPPLQQLQGYNPNFDADRIRKATKGFGTDERTLIDTLSPLDAFQVDLLSRTFESTTGRSLKVTLEKELSGWFEFVMVLKSLGPLGGDVYLLNRACKGLGTHEDLLTEILCGRSNAELHLLKEAFRRTYNKDLDATVRGELSMKTERMFNMILAGTRDEAPFVNQQMVQQDVETLYRAGPGKVGTDEIAICGVLCQRSDQHLQAIAQAFPNRHRVSLSHMIESEFSGHMRDALLHIARGAESDGQGVYRDVLALEAAMAGMGTKDERLCYRVVRCHWNRPRFAAVKNQYQQLYRKSLRKRVEGETSGKYEKALVGIIEQN